MILKFLSISGLGVCLCGLVACDQSTAGPGHDHDHAEHSHEKAGDDHDHGHKGHDHGGIVAGPNGGRVFTEIEPHLELFVTKDRRVRISQVTEDLKLVAIGDQAVSAIAGDRSNPTELTFKRDGDVLLSSETLPEGNDFPIVVDIVLAGGAKHREKFNLNLVDCPTCEYLEYACTCDHAHDH